MSDVCRSVADMDSMSTTTSMVGHTAATGVQAAAPGGALVSLEARRAAFGACRSALAGLREVLVACGDRDLPSLAAELAEVRALAGAGLVAVSAEAEQRGVIAASQCASTADWVADAAWHSRRESATVAKAAGLFTRDEYAPVAEALCDGDLDLASAVACGQEFAKLVPDLAEAARPLVLERLVDIACEHGPVGVRRLKDEILARYGEDGEFEEQCERRRRHIELSSGRQTEAGMWDYRLLVDGEGRAVLEAVIGPDSAPKPVGSGGDSPSPGGSTADGGAGQSATARDTRPVGRRRGEALIAALRRSVTATRHVPTSPKAILMITMDYADLVARIGDTAAISLSLASTVRSRTGRGDVGRNRTVPTGQVGTAHGPGVVLGSRAAGEPISPDMVRRIACDAGIIPVVIGGRGEVLDQGTMERCFTTGQVRALWRRDRHCTFPGCDVPAAWCDAHHLVHWIDGGATDLDNAALLCGRHHTVVHRDHLAGYVTQPRGGAVNPRAGRDADQCRGEPSDIERRPPEPVGAGVRRRPVRSPGRSGDGASQNPADRADAAVSWDLRVDSYRPAWGDPECAA